MLRLQLYGPVVTLNRLLVIFKLIVGCSQISMIGCYFIVEFNRSGGEHDFLLVISKLSEGPAFEVEKICTFLVWGDVKASVAGFGEFLPSSEVEAAVGFEQVLLHVIGHGLCESQQLLVLLFGLEFLDFGSCLRVSFEDHWPSVLEIIQFHLHLK